MTHRRTTGKITLVHGKAIVLRREGTERDAPFRPGDTDIPFPRSPLEHPHDDQRSSSIATPSRCNGRSAHANPAAGYIPSMARVTAAHWRPYLASHSQNYLVQVPSVSTYRPCPSSARRCATYNQRRHTGDINMQATDCGIRSSAMRCLAGLDIHVLLHVQTLLQNAKAIASASLTNPSETAIIAVFQALIVRAEFLQDEISATSVTSH